MAQKVTGLRKIHAGEDIAHLALTLAEQRKTKMNLNNYKTVFSLESAEWECAH